MASLIHVKDDKREDPPYTPKDCQPKKVTKYNHEYIFIGKHTKVRTKKRKYRINQYKLKIKYTQ